MVGLLAALQVVGASRILFLSPVSSKSHKNFYMGIINALADKGHQVGSSKASGICIVYNIITVESCSRVIDIS